MVHGLALIALSAALPQALALAGMSPIIAWSSHKSSLLDALAGSRHTHAQSLIESLTSSDELCAHDAVVLVDVPGLHATDLRTLSSSSLLAQTLQSAPSSLHVPYVSSDNDHLRTAAESSSARCGSRVSHLSPSAVVDVPAEKTEKHVLCMKMDELMATGGARKSAVALSEAALSDALHTLASLFPSHLVLLTGSKPSTAHLNARQFQEFDDPSLNAEPGIVIPDFLPPVEFTPASAFVPAAAAAPSNGTVTGGILKRYQLLTPGLITSLLLTFFVVMPAIFVGIRALSSIQAPRMEAVGYKGFNADVKKNQ